MERKDLRLGLTGLMLASALAAGCAYIEPRMVASGQFSKSYSLDNIKTEAKRLYDQARMIARSAVTIPSLDGIRTPGANYIKSGQNMVTLDRDGNIVALNSD